MKTNNEANEDNQQKQQKQQAVMSDLMETLNQCDGCMAGLPIVNGVHKDRQMFGIGCTKHLYVNSL